MQVSRDYEDLFKILNASKIRYLVVGAYAVMAYAEPRFTKDIDVWVIPEMNDPGKVFEALRAFGAPLVGVSCEDFRDKKLIVQIGVAPVRIDIMMDIPGVSFRTAWRNRKRMRFGKTFINIMGRKDLVAAKKSAGRDQDKLDLARLTRQSKD
jgi:Nucleotidyl transferase of unknown function (DUF2204)